MLNILISLAVLVCAGLAIREKRLLVAALWLALTSALVSWMMYRLGAAEAAVIELSVGAGLVTVLFVFAINIIGDEEIPERSLIPRPLAWALVAVGALILAWMTLPGMQSLAAGLGMELPGPFVEFQRAVWGTRAMDTLLQVALIFAGVMAILGLLNTLEPGGGTEDPHP